MKLVVLDPGLVGLVGHHYQVDRAIAEAAARRGLAVTVHAAAAVSAAVAAELVVCPTFRRPPEGPADLPTAQSFAAICEALNRAFAAELQAAGPWSFTAQDVVLVHSATVFELFGLHRWWSALAPPRPRLALVFRYPLEFRGTPADRPLAESLYARAFALWRAVPAHGLALFADNAALAARLAPLAGRPVPVAPVPIRHPPQPADFPLSAAERPARLVYLGEARLEKGLHLLLMAAPAFHRAHPDVRLIVHAGRGQALIELIDCLRPAAPSLEIRLEELADRDYFGLLQAADAVLLPYDPAAYAERTSHILLEALGQGRPVLVGDGGWMGAMMAQYGEPGVRVRAFDVAALGAALDELVRCFPALRARAARAAPEVRGAHNPDAFLEAVLAGLGGPA